MSSAQQVFSLEHGRQAMGWRIGPLLVGVAPGGGGVVGPPRPPPACMKGGSPPLGGPVQFYLGLGLRSGAPCWGGGRFDGENRYPLRTGCRPPPLLMMEHTWLLPVGDSMNINTSYFTFITFLLGFHGDGACE